MTRARVSHVVRLHVASRMRLRILSLIGRAVRYSGPGEISKSGATGLCVSRSLRRDMHREGVRPVGRASWGAGGQPPHPEGCPQVGACGGLWAGRLSTGGRGNAHGPGFLGLSPTTPQRLRVQTLWSLRNSVCTCGRGPSVTAVRYSCSSARGAKRCSTHGPFSVARG